MGNEAGMLSQGILPSKLGHHVDIDIVIVASYRQKQIIWAEFQVLNPFIPLLDVLDNGEILSAQNPQGAVFGSDSNEKVVRGDGDASESSPIREFVGLWVKVQHFSILREVERYYFDEGFVV